MQPARARDAIAEGGNNAALRVLRTLGWGSEMGSELIPDIGADGYVRLRLGPDLTAAGTQVTSSEDRWWQAYQLGARYHVAVIKQALHCYDFQERTHTMVAATEEGLERRLNGLSPRVFASTGTFGVVGTSTVATDVPATPPREYFTSMVQRWWRDWLKWNGKEANLQLTYDAFVVLVARLVLLRTIEDQGPPQWFQELRFRERATTPSEMNSAFDTLQTRVNSQVFARSSTLNVTSKALSSLVDATYISRKRVLDFTALEFNLIGRFYERILGKYPQLEASQVPQQYLGDLGPAKVSFITHRRNTGQYYTPRVFADYLARRAVLPRVELACDVTELPRVADIACGSGELLAATLRCMLSVRRFRTPSAIRYILEHKLVGGDWNPTATRLTALNLVRTAALYNRDVLDGEPAFPTLRLETLDSLSASAARLFKDVDVIVMNPPFMGQPNWSLPGSWRPKLGDAILTGKTNKATAFLLRAVDLLSAGGTVAAVLPNQFFNSRGDAALRGLLVKDLVPLEVVDNQGAEVFDGVSVQPGMLVADVRPAVRPPGLLHTILNPDSAKANALLSTGIEYAPGQVRRVLPAPAPGTEFWINEKLEAEVPTCRVADLLDGATISRGPIMTISPLKGAWTLERRGSEWVHPFSGITVSNAEEPADVNGIVRRCARPRSGGTFQLGSFFDANIRVVFPYHVEADRLTSMSMTQIEKVASPALLRVVEAVLQSAGASVGYKNKRDHEPYRRRLMRDGPSWFRVTGYSPIAGFTVMLSRMVNVRGDKARWNGWVLERGIVPTDGLIFGVQDPVFGAMLILLLNTRPVMHQLRGVASTRGPGTCEPSPECVMSLQLPDLRSVGLKGKTRAFRDAVERAAGRVSGETLRELVEHAESLWSV